MMLSWLVYAVVVSGLVSVAGWLAERGAWAQRWPSRWIWAGAMVASVVGPLAAWFAPSSSDAAAPLVAAPGAYVLESLPPLAVGTAAQSGLSVDVLLLGGWAVVSLLLLSVLAAAAIRLELRRRHWPCRTLDGVEVLVSNRMGPAAVGWLRGQVVVPEWVLGMEPSQRRLLLLHEAEHVRAADPQLSLAGLVVCALVPWNLPLWWQLRRLRLAIEVDCDARVLLRAPDPSAYGSLLLTVGRRRSHLAVALVESRPTLERRIGMITKTMQSPATGRAVALAAVSAVVLAAACETPGPTTPTGAAAAEQKPLELEGTVAGLEEMECEPAIYLDGSRSPMEGLSSRSPEEIEAIHVYKGPSAEDVREDGESCGVIVVVTKDASVEEADASRRLIERLGEERLVARRVEDVQDAPTFTPMTVRPGLKNAAEVREALQALYPPRLREAGIGDTVTVWFLIDRQGEVQRTLINRGSEHEGLDPAALEVAERMAFTPAYNREQRVPVWVSLSIIFDPTEGEGTKEATPQAGQEPGAQIVPRPAPSEPRPASSEPRPAPSEPPPAPEAPPESELSQEPTFTPMTEPPQLRNVDEVREALQERYPNDLRDAGIEGVAKVWFFIDESGAVQQTRLAGSSGHDAMDRAALAVGRIMEFTPGRNRDERVPVWVMLDIQFEAQ